MTIKTADGQNVNVIGEGQGLYNTITGTLGSLLGLMNGGYSILGGARPGVQPNGYVQGGDPNARYITKGELDLVQQLIAKDQTIASQGSTIALKESESYTEKKLVEVYANLENQNLRQDAKIEAVKDALNNFKNEQMQWNATATGTMSGIATQVVALQGITKMFVPSTSVCQTGCGCGCGCGANA